MIYMAQSTQETGEPSKKDKRRKGILNRAVAPISEEELKAVNRIEKKVNPKMA